MPVMSSLDVGIGGGGRAAVLGFDILLSVLDCWKGSGGSLGGRRVGLCNAIAGGCCQKLPCACNDIKGQAWSMTAADL